jgi:hypothetical protein
MPALIISGSLLSFAINKDAGVIALASFWAFGIAASIDALIYQALRGKKYMVRVNASNVGGALADSIIFPILAFGGFLPLITLGQFLAKVFGGVVWAYGLKGARQ